MSVATEFRDFVVRGNVIDLAVGLVVGAAFNGVVSSFTLDILTPLIGLPGKVNVANLHAGPILYGHFLNAVISFLLTAAAVFFFVVKPINHLNSRRRVDTVEATTKDCSYCLSAIPIKATRCAFCTAELPAAA